MSNKCNVRVENRKTNGSWDDRRKGFENMLRAFRRACDDQGIQNEYKKHEYYEKPSETRRRKKIEQQRVIERERFNAQKKQKQR